MQCLCTLQCAVKRLDFINKLALKSVNQEMENHLMYNILHRKSDYYRTNSKRISNYNAPLHDDRGKLAKRKN